MEEAMNEHPAGTTGRTRRWRALAAAALATSAVAAPTAASGDASVARVGPVVTVVPTAFVDNEAGVELMFAECDFVQRVEKPDGSSVERQSCRLTEPVPELPGTTPDRALANTAGGCTWFSDYFLATTGESLAADWVRLTVTPSGRVSVTTFYPPEPTPESEC
jgi:hypothetical protein